MALVIEMMSDPHFGGGIFFFFFNYLCKPSHAAPLIMVEVKNYRHYPNMLIGEWKFFEIGFSSSRNLILIGAM